MDKINSRVLALMDKLGKSKSELSRELDVSPSIISHITSGRNKVGLDLLQRLTATYTQVSVAWLLNGEGSMFQEEDSAKIEELRGSLNILKNQSDELESQMVVLRRSIDNARDLLY